MCQFLLDVNGYPCTRDGKIRGAKWVSRDFTETLADNELDAAIPPVVSKPQWHELEKLRACMVEAPLKDGIQLSKLAEPYVQKGTWQEGLHGTGGRLGAAGLGASCFRAHEEHGGTPRAAGARPRALQRAGLQTALTWSGGAFSLFRAQLQLVGPFERFLILLELNGESFLCEPLNILIKFKCLIALAADVFLEKLTLL